jgi:hypothetical protein
MLSLPNNYDQIYIVCFPSGAGGNFLINCLALADDCVFSNSLLARQQMDGKFGLENKCEYLSKHLAESNQSKTWYDLGLGNQHLFGFNFFWNDIDSEFTEIVQYKISSAVKQLILSKKKFFLVCHDISMIPRLKSIWPKARLILFTEFRQFITSRNYAPKEIQRQTGLSQYWIRIKDSSWPAKPPQTLAQFSQLPQSLQNELIHHHEFEISRWFDFASEFDQSWHAEVDHLVDADPDNAFVWDVAQSYANDEQLIVWLDRISKHFGFSLVDTKIISCYYQSWIETIIHNINHYDVQYKGPS